MERKCFSINVGKSLPFDTKNETDSNQFPLLFARMNKKDKRLTNVKSVEELNSISFEKRERERERDRGGAGNSAVLYVRK